MSRKLVATLCLGLASIGNAAVEAAATELGGASDMQTVTSLTGENGRSGHVDTGLDSIAGSAWLVRHAADPDARPRRERSRSTGFATHRAIDLGSGIEGGAAAGFDFDFDLDGMEMPVHRGDVADWLNAPQAGATASLGAAAGFQFGPVQAGPFSTLTYTGAAGGGSAIGFRDATEQSLTGSVGLQAMTQLDGALGPSDTQFRLSLDQDLFVERDTVDSALDPWRRNIFVEEVDASEFDFENAIVFLKHRGRVPGWFFYEARVRVRTTGLRAVTGRIWVKW